MSSFVRTFVRLFIRSFVCYFQVNVVVVTVDQADQVPNRFISCILPCSRFPTVLSKVSRMESNDCFVVVAVLFFLRRNIVGGVEWMDGWMDLLLQIVWFRFGFRGSIGFRSATVVGSDLERSNFVDGAPCLAGVACACAYHQSFIGDNQGAVVPAAAVVDVVVV